MPLYPPPASGTAWQTLTDGATISWNAASGNGAQVTLGGNRTLSNPTGLVAGQTYRLLVIQDATGGRLVTWGNAYYWPGGFSPTLSAGGNTQDLLVFSSDGTHLYYQGGQFALLVQPPQPNDLANLALWLKADALTGHSAGDAISSWTDSSAAGNTATQATGTKQPLYQTGIINSLPALQFDATDDGMATALAISSGGYTVFAVVKPSTASGSHRYVQGSSNFILGHQGTQARFYNGQDIGSSTGTIVSGTPLYLTGWYNGITSVLYVNGAQANQATGGGYPGTVDLGGVGAFNEPPQGYLAEVLVYSRALTSTELTQIHYYLHTRYNI
jgi:hypothetical protein